MIGDCGGCRDLGAHRRWCPEQVGPRAARLGDAAERAESLADQIGALDPAAANDCYRASGRLRERATHEAILWKGSAVGDSPTAVPRAGE